jgi:hypothetical protein
MSPLERRCRWLLRAYPGWYRRERGEEMLATLLEASQPGQNWPSARDSRALIMGGLRIRAAQDQRLTTAANLRLAVQLGATLTVLSLVADEGSSDVLSWTHVYSPNVGTGYSFAYAVLGLAAVVAAWLAPRPVAAVIALTAAAAWVYWGDRVMAILPAGLLVTLAVLVFLGERLPRSWLWLAGAFFAVDVLQQLTAIPRLYFLFVPLTVVPWILLGLVVLWAVVDARPAVALGIYLACTYLVTDLLSYVGYGVTPLAVWQWGLPAIGVAVLAAGSFWRLRRQAAL